LTSIEELGSDPNCFVIPKELGSDPNCFVIPDLIRDPWFAGDMDPASGAG
jgi:hypothetical protein